jgi:hypothetical protein
MSDQHASGKPVTNEDDAAPVVPSGGPSKDVPNEVGGRGGPDPARYGDWEKNGRCIDF